MSPIRESADAIGLVLRANYREENKQALTRRNQPGVGKGVQCQTVATRWQWSLDDDLVSQARLLFFVLSRY